MKKIYFFAILAVILTAGCTPKVRTEAVDLNAVKDTIDQLAEKYLNALISRDIDVLATLVADDGLFCGTDPSELFDKPTLVNYWTQMISDTTNDYSYKVDQRKIRVAADGKSAIVMEYITAGSWSPVMKIRQTYQVVKNDNKWQIDYISWGFLVRNEDVGKVNKALMPEDIVQ